MNIYIESIGIGWHKHGRGEGEVRVEWVGGMGGMAAPLSPLTDRRS